MTCFAFAAEEEDTTKGRLYKLIGGVHTVGGGGGGGYGGGHDHHHHDDHEYHHYHKCECAPGPPGPPGPPGHPGRPGRDGRDGYYGNNGGVRPPIGGRDADYRGDFYDDYDYGYSRKYNDHRPPTHYRDERPRDYDYDRRPIPPPRRDFDRYDVPLKPAPVSQHDDRDRDIRIPDDAPDSDFEKRLNEGRSFSGQRRFVSFKKNPFVTYV